MNLPRFCMTSVAPQPATSWHRFDEWSKRLFHLFLFMARCDCEYSASPAEIATPYTYKRPLEDSSMSQHPPTQYLFPELPNIAYILIMHVGHQPSWPQAPIQGPPLPSRFLNQSSVPRVAPCGKPCTSRPYGSDEYRPHVVHTDAGRCATSCICPC